MVLAVSCHSRFDDPPGMLGFRSCVVGKYGGLAFLLVVLGTPWYTIKGLQKLTTILILDHCGDMQLVAVTFVCLLSRWLRH